MQNDFERENSFVRLDKLFERSYWFWAHEMSLSVRWNIQKHEKISSSRNNLSISGAEMILRANMILVSRNNLFWGKFENHLHFCVNLTEQISEPYLQIWDNRLGCIGQCI